MKIGTPAAGEINNSRLVKSFGCRITRQVSQENIAVAATVDNTNAIEATSKALPQQNDMGKLPCRHGGRGSPMRCVSEIDKITAASSLHSQEPSDSTKCQAKENTGPLHNRTTFEHHKMAVRLEAELHPLRLILTRLMAHPTHNRRGIFNTPVDHVALGLPDYVTIISQPMDFGTIKARLYSVSYKNCQQAVDDIRLVLSNAMLYNPPNNLVHISAKGLLDFFEEQLRSFLPDLLDEDAPMVDATHLPPSSLTLTATNAQASKQPLGTRGHASVSSLPPLFSNDFKRCKRGSKRNPTHSCQFCKGMKCDICEQGCLSLEPMLLICNGAQCSGARIRKGATYFIAQDGSRQYCDRCHTGLPSVLPGKNIEDGCRYKRDLLKRKNDEEVVEKWLSCVSCGVSVHEICAMQMTTGQDLFQVDFVCQSCTFDRHAPLLESVASESDQSSPSDMWTFVAGSVDPVPLESVCPQRHTYPAEKLEETPISQFIQTKVRDLVSKESDCPNASKTITVRVISDCDRSFTVPDVVRKHFRMVQNSSHGKGVPPTAVAYRSKAIMLFQKIDGMDVCIFCMYVHEYSHDQDSSTDANNQEKRVYIAYLDSVEHFSPRPCRTPVYQEMLISYLATAAKRGYKTAHIWACPPTRGNSFVFWNHPASQRTPNQERLVAWYNETLSHAVERGVVKDIKSLYETCFEPLLEETDDPELKAYQHDGPMVCPPLLDGDFWIEEAVRLHDLNFLRHLRAKTLDGRITSCDVSENGDHVYRSAVAQIAKLLRERIIEHPDSALFRKPVNAAALKLKDYHKIVTSPMDLGTIYSRLIFGEYEHLAQLVGDFELMVSNAKRYNPKGHFVHSKAEELSERFFEEIVALVVSWNGADAADRSKWSSVSLALDAGKLPAPAKAEPEGETTKPVKLAPLSSGPDAVHKHMVGADYRLFDKSHLSGKPLGLSKKAVGGGKRRFSLSSSDGEPAAKRRRQSWLGEQVGSSVRRMRPYFYACSLSGSKSSALSSYAESFHVIKEDTGVSISSRIADVRHSFLEFSQFHHLEFDTLRRSKYSTAILLYHLHNDNTSGVVPACSGCRQDITNVRWHKIGKVLAYTNNTRKCFPPTYHKRPLAEFVPEELCHSCFGQRTDKSDFIPIQVTLK